MAAATPEEELANWEELYAEFSKATPSSPVWYQLADMCIGILMADKIAQLKATTLGAGFTPQQSHTKGM
jgi:hypothetical protein